MPVTVHDKLADISTRLVEARAFLVEAVELVKQSELIEAARVESNKAVSEENERLKAKLAKLEQTPVPQPPPVVTLPGPTAPTPPRNPRTLSTQVELKGGNATIEDTTFAAGTTGDAAVMVRANGARIARIQIGSRDRYGIYVEGVEDVTIEDVLITGKSKHESEIRTGPGTSGLMRRVSVNGSGKANIRGAGTWRFEDVRSEGAIWGMNPLGKGDGGQGFLLDRTIEGNVTNPEATRQIVMAAVDAGEADLMKLREVFGSIALVWKNPRDKSQGAKPYMPSDDVWRRTIAHRKRELDARAHSTLTRCYATFGFGVEAGSTYVCDGTNTFEPVNGLIREHSLEYPPPSHRLPGDTIRPAPTFTGNGDVVNSAKGWGVNDDIARKILRGWFVLNGKRVEFPQQ